MSQQLSGFEQNLYNHGEKFVEKGAQRYFNKTLKNKILGRKNEVVRGFRFLEEVFVDMGIIQGGKWYTEHQAAKVLEYLVHVDLSKREYAEGKHFKISPANRPGKFYRISKCVQTND